MIAGADLWRVESDEHLARLLRLVLPVHPAVPKVAEGTLRRLVRQALDLVAAGTGPARGAAAREARARAAPRRRSAGSTSPARGRRSSPRRARLVFDRLLSQALAVRAASHAAAGPAPALESFVRGARRGSAGASRSSSRRARSGALDEILADLERPVAMRRLLLGDVGSGKTAVAAGALLASVAAGHQGLLVAPTDALAAQHHATLSGVASGLARPARAALRARPDGGRRRRSGGRSAAARSTSCRHPRGARRRRRVPDARARRLRRAAPVRRAAADLGAQQGEAAAPARAQRDADPAFALPRAVRRARDHASRRTPGACPTCRPRACLTPPPAYSAVREAVARGERAFVVFPSIEGAERRRASSGRGGRSSRRRVRSPDCRSASSTAGCRSSARSRCSRPSGAERSRPRLDRDRRGRARRAGSDGDRDRGRGPVRARVAAPASRPRGPGLDGPASRSSCPRGRTLAAEGDSRARPRSACSSVRPTASGSPRRISCFAGPETGAASGSTASAGLSRSGRARTGSWSSRSTSPRRRSSGPVTIPRRRRTSPRSAARLTARFDPKDAV